MAVPKRKKSKMKIRMRKAQKKAEIPAITTCPACGAPVQTHRACPACGYYRGRKVVDVEA
ncbi:MAG: 50S ribosomal protein L32 [Kiritimatiellae bacterium]|nr:50S ribosomal protein L32 [Kiritimatiellia bacterium]MBR1837165.1 50S ribosomal protein L32 [Kiritimatiellia bacterium]